MKSFFLVFSLASIFLLASGCSGTPARASAPTATAAAIHTEAVATAHAAGIHTQVAATMFAAAAPTPTTTPSPAPARVALALTQEHIPTESAVPTTAVTPEVISVPTLQNVPLLEGASNFGVRVLERPAAVVREGITLAVEQVIVFPDHIELVYTLRDIPHAVLHNPFSDDMAYSCGGPDSYANLILPNGEIIYPEAYLLDGKAWGTMEAFASGYLIHIYRVTLPAEVREMRFSLACLGLAHLERAPLNWEVPFRVAPVGEVP